MGKSKNILVVGDPHVTSAEMADAIVMRDQVQRIEKEEKVDLTVWLGDLFDNFGLKDIEVEAFWNETFALTMVDQVALVGNHDRRNDASSSFNSLDVFADEYDDHEYVAIINRPREFQGMGFVPFCFTPEEFLAGARALAGFPTLFCHQALSGVRYDSGHPVDDGANPSTLPQELIISGHIHTAQSYGKVWYPGSPRWRTAHDANKAKSIWLLTMEDGRVVASKEYESECSPLITILDDETASATQGAVNPKARYIVDIKGSKAYIERRCREWRAHPNVRIRSFPTDKRTAKVKESDGIPQAFAKFCQEFVPPRGTSQEALLKAVNTRMANYAE